MPIAVITLDLDPILRLGALEVRLETIALAVALVVSLLIAGLIARVTPAAEPTGRPDARPRLRLDDLLLVAIAAVPGAVGGGRLGYVLIHLDYYAAHPGLILDPAQGSLELTLGVVGGILTAVTVLWLVGAPVGRWAHVAACPLLLALGTGKLVTVLGGDGQGLPSDLPWAIAYRGEGPWGSLGPELPSHPAQVYEGLLTLGVLLVVTALIGRAALRRADGTSLLVALLLWALVRAAVASTWRDEMVLAGLRAEQLIALLLAAACLGLLVGRWLVGRRTSRGVPSSPDVAGATFP